MVISATSTTTSTAFDWHKDGERATMLRSSQRGGSRDGNSNRNRNPDTGGGIGAQQPRPDAQRKCRVPCRPHSTAR